MSDEIRFSVAMCTYNGEKYLREQLDSIANQSELPAELVVCDDGSTDGTVEILREFARSSPFPVRLFQNEVNLGVARNFFKAIKLCQLDWVMLCDQDDVWMKDRIESFRNAIRYNTDALLIQSDAHLINEKSNILNHSLFKSYGLTTKEIKLLEGNEGLKVLLRHVFATGAGMAVSRSFVTCIPVPDKYFLHDEWIAWFACPNIAILQEKTFCYRQHSHQLTGINRSLKNKISKLVKSGKRHFINLDEGMCRYQSLINHLSDMEDKHYSDTITGLDLKIEFINWRINLSKRLVSRAFDVLKIDNLKKYFLFASGYKTVVKDLVGSDLL